MIATEADLLRRLGVPRETAAMAAQTVGVKAYLHAMILKEGESRILGFAPDGKRAETVVACWERIYGADFHPKKKRARTPMGSKNFEKLLQGAREAGQVARGEK